jgi:V/A-type H+-transporting ATPase subunit E
MDTKIQELTEKIYREGVEKGNDEAAKIVAGANEQKTAILRNAEIEAAQIKSVAEKQALEMKKNAEAELKLYGIRFIEGLKSDITNMITGKIISKTVNPVVNDKDFMQRLILEIAKNWASDQELTIQASDAEELAKYFKGKVENVIISPNEIKKEDKKSVSFTIAPADGSYKVVFGEEEFVAYFKEYLRPQLAELLF